MTLGLIPLNGWAKFRYCNLIYRQSWMTVHNSPLRSKQLWRWGLLGSGTKFHCRSQTRVGAVLLSTAQKTPPKLASVSSPSRLHISPEDLIHAPISMQKYSILHSSRPYFHMCKEDMAEVLECPDGKGMGMCHLSGLHMADVRDQPAECKNQRCM